MIAALTFALAALATARSAAAIAPPDAFLTFESGVLVTEGLTPREKVYLGIDPLEYARRVRCPVLVVQGGADLHVPLRSAERLAAAMRAGGNRDVTVRIFPGVSHSLLPDPNGLSSGWVLLPAFRTSPQLLDTVAGWTAARLARRGLATAAQH